MAAVGMLSQRKAGNQTRCEIRGKEGGVEEKREEGGRGVWRSGTVMRGGYKEGAELFAMFAGDVQEGRRRTHSRTQEKRVQKRVLRRS